MSLSYIPHLFNAFLEVLRYLFKVYILRVPVSFPGDKLPNPQFRKGQWPDKTTHATKEWINAVADESHERTNAIFPNTPLTGESYGRQTWHKVSENETKTYLTPNTDLSFNPSKNPNSGDKIFRAQMIHNWIKNDGKLPDESSVPSDASEAVFKAISFYQMLQTEDGHWAGDYGGPMFLMPGLISVLYITKAPFPEGSKELMIKYLLNHQQTDGGWGTHIECASTMFGSILSYVSLRLLGISPDTPEMKKAREFIHKHGGALYAPSWAKFWLAVIGCFAWEGINPIPVELWLLPRWFPFHPGKLWCHCRMVYLPMGYVFGKKFVPDVENDEILSGLRKELYLEDYNKINWDDFRQTVAAIDEYSPLNPVMKVIQDACAVYERFFNSIPILKTLREKSLQFCIKYIHEEDKQTNYIDIGPVNKALNMLSVWLDCGKDVNSPQFQRHLTRVQDYLWVAEDGMKMQGYNGSQCWDTSFAIQAIDESGLAPKFPNLIRKAYKFFDRTQIKNDEENREYFFRHISKGGWPFSTAAHGWPISDCTAEGLKGVATINRSPVLREIVSQGDDKVLLSDARLYDACDILLSYQNEDGGWATYENNRGSGWYEMFNPSEVFGDIMIDYSYVECSSASMTALKSFLENVPNYRVKEIKESIEKGGEFIKSIQRPDGSWYGSWGNCFTYGTWFGVEGLKCANEKLSSSHAMKRAVRFVLSKQNVNGGWGESYLACVNKDYPSEGTCGYGEGNSGVVQTAWAVLTLLAAYSTDPNAPESSECLEAAKKGVEFLMKRQLPNGDWEQEGITGVFNRSCGITYTAYRNVFPIWALGRYARLIEKK